MATTSNKLKLFRLFRGDKTLWIIITILSIASILVIYSSTGSMAYSKLGGNTSYYVFRQLGFVILGLSLTTVFHWIDFSFYLKKYKKAFWICILLVVLAFVMGVSFNEAKRWIMIPIIKVTFAPSDPLKIALVLLLAVKLGNRQEVITKDRFLPDLTPSGWARFPVRNRNIWNSVTKPIILPIAVAVLVVMPNNLSTALLLAATSFLMLVVARVKWRELGRMALVAVMAVVLIVGVMKLTGIGRADTWINRIESFATSAIGLDNEGVDKETAELDFQKEQARIAVAMGGLTGKGPGNSTQRSQLPHPYSDFAYAFVVEEYGAFGGTIVLLLYLWMLYRAGVIMRRSQSSVKSLVVFGLVISIVIQAFINMCVSVGLGPVTGQTLPLISLGGSSHVFTSIALGIVLSISRESDERIRQQRLERLKEQNGVEITDNK